MVLDYHCYWYLLSSYSSVYYCGYYCMYCWFDFVLGSLLLVGSIYNKLSLKCLLFILFSIFVLLFIFVSCYYYVIFIHLSFIDYYFSWIILTISYIVIVYSYDYIDLFDWYIYFILIYWFHFAMLLFILCNDYLLGLLFWELLGISSYLLLNFWSNKNHSGIMALIYNKVGDILFLYSLITCFYILLSFDLELVLLFAVYYSIHYHIFLASIIGSFTTKSALLPFSSWLIYAMSAPTPISSLLHSSTMVIAGLFICLLLCLFINLVIYDYLFDSSIHHSFNSHSTIYSHCSFYYYYLSSISVLTILFSSIIALFIVDIKSIIAYSTIGQIAYIALNLFVSTIVSIIHIFIHSFYKCLLFLLSAEVIHNIESNWQSIYLFTINNSLIRVYYIIAGVALIFASTKEGILHATIYHSIYLFILLFITSSLSLLYVLLILCFIMAYNSRILLSLSMFGFLSIIPIILFADKSIHYSIYLTDYPHSFPFISITITSILLSMYYLLLSTSYILLTIFYSLSLSIYLSFPFPFWSPAFITIHYISSTNFYRSPVLLLDLFGRFRALFILFFRFELSLIVVFIISLIIYKSYYKPNQVSKKWK